MPIPRPSETDQIPLWIHQTWKTQELPDVMKPSRQAFEKHHPHFQYTLWDDKMNQEMMEKHFPWFLSTYEGFDEGVMKADAARIGYLYLYGGIYADTDVVPHASLESLIHMTRDMNNIALVTTPNSAGDKNYHTSNSFMISKPKHEFWLFVMRSMQNPVAKRSGLAKFAYANFRYWKIILGTGPNLVNWCRKQWNKDHPDAPIGILHASQLLQYTESINGGSSWHKGESDSIWMKLQRHVVDKRELIMGILLGIFMLTTLIFFILWRRSVHGNKDPFRKRNYYRPIIH